MEFRHKDSLFLVVQVANQSLTKSILFSWKSLLSKKNFFIIQISLLSCLHIFKLFPSIVSSLFPFIFPSSPRCPAFPPFLSPSHLFLHLFTPNYHLYSPSLPYPLSLIPSSPFPLYPCPWPAWCCCRRLRTRGVLIGAATKYDLGGEEGSLPFLPSITKTKKPVLPM